MIAATEPGERRLQRWARSPALIVAVVAAGYACLVTYPLILQLSTSIYGGPGDATGTVAVYMWWSYAIHHHMSIFDNTMWGAPYGAGWQAVPFSVLPVILLAPLSAVIGGTATYNVEVLSSFPLTAWLTFLLARRLGARPLAAAFSALAFTFLPYHLEKAQGHSGQTHMEFFSATLLFLMRWRQGGSRWNLAVAGAIAGLTLWNDYYFAFISAFMVATFFALSLLYRRSQEPPPTLIWRHLAAALTLGIVTALFVPATILVAERPWTGSLNSALAAQSAGFHQSLEEVRIYSARPWEFVLPYHDNPLLPRRIVQFEVAHIHGSNFTEQTLFLGYTVMLLAALGVFVTWPRFETLLLLALGVVGLVVSLPPGISVAGHTIPTPSLLLNPIFPIFRVYARFGVLVLLGAALLAGLGFTWLQDRLRGRQALLLALPFILTAIEFNNLPPSHVTRLFPAPAEYRWLANQSGGILIEYPLRAGTLQEQEIETRQYTLYQQSHGHPLFNGATTASVADPISELLEPYYGPGVADTLRQIGIRYVFVHRADYIRDGFVLPQNTPGLDYVDTLDGTDVYVIRSP